jgi:hypothetical protein
VFLKQKHLIGDALRDVPDPVRDPAVLRAQPAATIVAVAPIRANTE